MNTAEIARIFDYEGREIRVVVLNDAPWFVATDVCSVLDIGNASDAVRRLDDDERGVVSIDTPNGRQVSVNAVTEPGLYSLILGSRKAEARTFKRWITHEVLPQIRRTGSYAAAGSAALPDMTTPEGMVAVAEMLGATARKLVAAEKTIAVVSEERDTVTAALESATPAIAYHERYVVADDVVTVKAWAAQFGLTDPQARDLLVSRNIVYRQSIGHRWSDKANAMVEEFEYRARAGRVTFDWFDLRPQHNAPRHHNGQVRQTLYVRQARALELGRKLGLLAEPMAAIETGGAA